MQNRIIQNNKGIKYFDYYFTTACFSIYLFPFFYLLLHFLLFLTFSSFSTFFYFSICFYLFTFFLLFLVFSTLSHFFLPIFLLSLVFCLFSIFYLLSMSVFYLLLACGKEGCLYCVCPLTPNTFSPPFTFLPCYPSLLKCFAALHD